MVRDTGAEGGLSQAFAMIVASEIGDKTFFIVRTLWPLRVAQIYLGDLGSHTGNAS